MGRVGHLRRGARRSQRFRWPVQPRLVASFGQLPSCRCTAEEQTCWLRCRSHAAGRDEQQRGFDLGRRKNGSENAVAAETGGLCRRVQGVCGRLCLECCETVVKRRRQLVSAAAHGPGLLLPSRVVFGYLGSAEWKEKNYKEMIYDGSGKF